VSARGGGLVEEANFVAPQPVRQLRNLTRYGRTQIQERAREVNRLHKALEDAGIKLDCVAADILGKSGRDMLDALVAGTTDPGRARRPRAPADAQEDPGAARSPGGSLRLTPPPVDRRVRHIDFLDEQIEQLTGMIEEQIGPFDPAVEPRCTITAIQRRGAEPIVGEIGVDTTCFRSPRHLASWAGQCPGNDKSAGKRRSGKTRNGSKWLDFALKEAAMAAIRVKGHSPEAQYRRLKPRRGHKHALGAVKHPILGAIWHMLVTGETHRDLGGDHFTNRDPERQTRRLVKQLERLGHHATLTEGAAAT
jgi:transposase